MSKYPDHQVQALADFLYGNDPVGLHKKAEPGSSYWKDALAALEFLGIEPEIPPTITVTVELPREEAERWAYRYNGYEGITGTVAAAIRKAPQ